MLPITLPFVEERKERWAHLLRHKLAPAVWLSVCALPQKSEFDAFSSFLQSTRHPDIPIVSEIYRTSSEAMRHPVFRKTLDDILKASAQAGRELVRSMEVSQDTMDRITQPLNDAKDLVTIGNSTFNRCITDNITLKEFFDKGMAPRPDSLKAFMAYSVLGLNAEAADGKKVVLQFRFSGEVEGSCYFTFEAGKIKSATGNSATYDVAITIPFEMWMDIMNGKADGREMFMQGKYKVDGDIFLMQDLVQKKREH